MKFTIIIETNEPVLDEHRQDWISDVVTDLTEQIQNTLMQDVECWVEEVEV